MTTFTVYSEVTKQANYSLSATPCACRSHIATVVSASLIVLVILIVLPDDRVFTQYGLRNPVSISVYWALTPTGPASRSGVGETVGKAWGSGLWSRRPR